MLVEFGPVLQLITNYACPRDLLYVVRQLQCTAPPELVPADPELQRLELACYDETALKDGPLWTTSSDEFRILLYDAPYVVAPVRPSWQKRLDGLAGNTIYVLDAYRDLFRANVRTREVQRLPAPPYNWVRRPAVAADADWFWMCGSRERVQPSFAAFDARVDRWHAGLLPRPLTRHTMTSIGHNRPPCAASAHPVDSPEIASKSVTPPSAYACDETGCYDAAVLVGGAIVDEGFGGASAGASRQCWLMRWNPSKGLASWLSLPPMLEGRSGHVAIVLDGRLIVLGGDYHHQTECGESLDLSRIELGWTPLHVQPNGPYVTSVPPAVANGRLVLADGTVLKDEGQGMFKLHVDRETNATSTGLPSGLVCDVSSYTSIWQWPRIAPIVALPSD